MTVDCTVFVCGLGGETVILPFHERENLIMEHVINTNSHQEITIEVVSLDVISLGFIVFLKAI